MHRPILTCAFLVLATAAFAQQQQPSPSDPYQGQSNPPADDAIVATQPDQPTSPKAKPRAGTPVAQSQAQPPAPAAAAPAPAQNPPADASANPPSSVDPSANYPDPAVTGTDDGVVGIAKPQPALMSRGASADPDGDIVHPNPLQPGQLAYGSTIRVRLLTRLSTDGSKQGEAFRTSVASDVLQDGQVLIPAGAEIDGRVAQVSSGTIRSHGTILLRPETVILLDGSRYHLDAQVSGTPGSKTRVNGEGFINPPSRVKKNAMLYGAAVGTGVAVGAVLGGGVGAVTGGAIGAGFITVHVLTKHSEATLEPGTVLLFTLDNRLDLQAATPRANPNGN